MTKDEIKQIKTIYKQIYWFTKKFEEFGDEKCCCLYCESGSCCPTCEKEFLEKEICFYTKICNLAYSAKSYLDKLLEHTNYQADYNLKINYFLREAISNIEDIQYDYDIDEVVFDWLTDHDDIRVRIFPEFKEILKDFKETIDIIILKEIYEKYQNNKYII